MEPWAEAAGPRARSDSLWRQDRGAERPLLAQAPAPSQANADDADRGRSGHLASPPGMREMRAE